MAITYGNVGFNKVDLRPVGININIFPINIVNLNK